MSDEMIIHCCAPTMAALKTGSVFNCPFESEEEMRNSLSEINVCLKRKGVSVVALRYRKGRGLVYFYRPKMLEEDLKGHLAKELLADYGYPEEGTEEKIAHLRRRFDSSRDFPHELGLFLGYPAVDVKGFINGSECVYTGLWKVYESDLRKARELFERCRDCTKCFLRLSKEGWSLYNLTINK
ncbi:DUF3793 family protein [bacterium]|nr:DUF3793 family protein [bacterium]